MRGGEGGGSNRSNFGTFYDYAWIILRSRWIWPFCGGSDDPPDPPHGYGPVETMSLLLMLMLSS